MIRCTVVSMPTETVINPAALRALIDKDGITQYQLAAQSGVSKQMISDILGGKRNTSPATRKALAEALRVPLSAIETLREL